MIKATECEYDFDEDELVLIHQLNGGFDVIEPGNIRKIVPIEYSGGGELCIISVIKPYKRPTYSIPLPNGDSIPVPKGWQFGSYEIISTDSRSSIISMLDAFTNV